MYVCLCALSYSTMSYVTTWLNVVEVLLSEAEREMNAEALSNEHTEFYVHDFLQIENCKAP